MKNACLCEKLVFCAVGRRPWLCLVFSVGLIATSFLSCKDSCIWGSCRVLWGAGETALWPHTFPGMAWSTYSALQQTSAGWVRDTVKMVVFMHTENLFICTSFYTFLCSGYEGPWVETRTPNTVSLKIQRKWWYVLFTLSDKKEKVVLAHESL